MTSKPIRIKVKCDACSAALILKPEQYKHLIKRSQISLTCPQCSHRFVYQAMTVRTRKRTARTAPQSPVEVMAGAVEEPPRPPAPARNPALEFPPPPFAPLGLGAATPAPEMAPAPCFAQLGAGPAAPTVQEAVLPAAAGSAARGTKKPTLNERFKSLPNWVQWLVIGLVILVLAVVIFALPVGGSGGGTPENGAIKNQAVQPAPEGKPNPKETPEKRQP
jgi:hypothetical protein